MGFETKCELAASSRNVLNYASPLPPVLPNWAWRVSVVAVGVSTYAVALLALLFFAGVAASN